MQHINKGLGSGELGDAPNQLAKGTQRKNGNRDEGAVHRSEISNHNDQVERSSTSLVNGIKQIKQRDWQEFKRFNSSNVDEEHKSLGTGMG